ncbi:MAG: alpha/beta hydrolase [Deferribacteres bacterium]|nr:alpha/beta hydrolase [candidate division KSB1 bacterium]MCB9504226.1 alpha/beta hydrolase [Deferribacteres bacterium]
MRTILPILSLFIVATLVSGCASSRFYRLPAKEFTNIDYGYPVKTTTVRNIHIAMIDEGRGDETIILIHGLGTNAKGWTKNIPVLAEKYRVIALDLPGYGKSDKGYYDYSMSFYAQVIKELMEKLGVWKAVLIGHSMGGQIAMTAALEHPEIVEKLVLISPAGFERFTEGEAAWMKGAMKVDFIKDTPIRNIDINLKANFYDYPKDAEFMITDRIQVRGASDFENYCYAVSRNVWAMLDGPVYMRLKDIKQPTLILFGENDGLIPNPYLHAGFTKDVAQIGKSEIPNSSLKLFPQCGHFVQFEKAQETNKAIKEFLSN